MKKIIIGILSLTILFTGGSVFANSIWNTASNDCKTIAIANYTTNTGYTNPCWPLSTVNANKGDSINIRVYYHNTSTQNATNTRVIINTPTNSSTTHTFSGQILSDQGSVSFGPVSVHLNTAQKLTFGSARWYPNQTQNQINFLYGQDGSEIISGGLSIGTIAPGWSTQGSVVLSFHINNPQPTGVITANPNSCIIQAGSNKCLIPFSWNTTDPINTSTVINGEGSIVATSNNGNQSFNVSYGSSIFRLLNNNTELDTEAVSASCATGSDWDNFNLVCKAQILDCEITSFTSNKTNVDSGSPVVLSWNTNYCNSVSISGVGSNLSSNGSITVYPTNTITYTLTGIGNTTVSPTRNLEIIAGGPVFAPGFPAGAPGYKSN